MRIIPRWAVGVMGVLAVAALTPAARAQAPGRPVFVPAPAFTTVRVQTTVTVPDRGSVVLGGYSQMSEGRSEFGAPVLGRLPYAGRGFRNVGYGRDVLTGRVGVSVRIIDLREEEFRQTGVRSR